MPAKLPPLASLRAFEAAARHLSFAKAAEDLLVTPGAVSQQVKQLEDWLGVALFRRLPKGVLLTDAGQLYGSELREAEVGIESWRRHHNTIRPHASLGFRPPAPEVFVPAFAAWPAALRRPASPTLQAVAPKPTLN